MNEEYIPISQDTIKIYGFRFGRYRYQVEWFDHNKSKNISDNDDKYDRVLKCKSYWDTLYGTKIYRFLDWEFDLMIHSTFYFNSYIEENKLKEMILNDVIDWKPEDPYDFKDRFITDKYTFVSNKLYPAETERVNHNYPECTEPYDKCPICGGELDGSVEEIECCEDIFNGKSGYSYEGEGWSEWEEVHRCPHCEKLFFINAYT